MGGYPPAPPADLDTFQLRQINVLNTQQANPEYRSIYLPVASSTPDFNNHTIMNERTVHTITITPLPLIANLMDSDENRKRLI